MATTFHHFQNYLQEVFSLSDVFCLHSQQQMFSASNWVILQYLCSQQNLCSCREK